MALEDAPQVGFKKYLHLRAKLSIFSAALTITTGTATAVQWGVGRYIYSLELERDWLPVDQYRKFTEQPRLKGSAPRPVQRPTEPVAAPPAAAPPSARRGFWLALVDMGHNRDLVL